MIQQELCPMVEYAPDEAHMRRWTLRDDNNHHHHGVVNLSESPLYLLLSFRSTADSPVRRVGLFQLDLFGLLRQQYVRREPIDSTGSDIRLRIVHEVDGHFYIQVNSDQPRLKII